MSGPIRLAELGSIIGDPARAVMLCVLLDGRGHSATELSLAAGVSPQTASWHLAKLADGQLVTAEKRGRNRNFRLASRLVARTLEAMMSMAGSRSSKPHVLSERERALRDARTCYDHFARRLGVALTDAFKKRNVFQHRHQSVRHTTIEASVLPIMPRLERTETTSRRRLRGGLCHALLRSGLGAAFARHTGCRNCARRRQGL